MNPYKEYYQRKNDLQQKQFNEQKLKYGKGELFRNVVVWITGRTYPSASILRSLVLQNGGKFQMHYSVKLVTHIIATQLSYQHKIQYEGKIVVHPNWIIDSLRLGTLQAIDDYNPNKSKAHNKTDSDEFRCTDPNFLEKYYAASRLHHISLWKTTFSDTLKERIEGITAKYSKLIHIDIDSFFVSVTLAERPELRGKPVVVSHGGNNADVSSCSYEARSFGIKSGMWIKKALELCPQLIIVDYDFDGYERTATKMYDTLIKYFKNIEVLSCDECIVDISTIVEPSDQFIQKLRLEIKEKIQCPVSIGVGLNPLTARMAMKKAKPDGFYSLLTNIEEFMSTITIEQLPGFGQSLAYQCEQIGVRTCADVFVVSEATLRNQIGKKNSDKLREMSRGIDRTDFSLKERKSVGMSINWGIRFGDDEEVKEFIFRMCCEVSKRLDKAKVMGSLMVMQVMERREGVGEAVKYKGHGIVDVHSKSIDITETKDATVLNKSAVTLWNQLRIDAKELRGVSIQITKLRTIQPVQIRKSKVFQQLIGAKEKEKKEGKKKKDSKRKKFVELPTASQLDVSVLNALPLDIKNELVQYYTSYYNIYNNPRISFKHEKVQTEEDIEGIETDLFEVEDNAVVCETLTEYLKTRERMSLFHLEFILQYLKVLLKHHLFHEFQIIMKVVLSIMEQPKYDDFKEILGHYAEEMYFNYFTPFVDSFKN